MPRSSLHNEKELLSRIAESDRKAFTELYSTHYPLLFKYLLFVTRSKDHANELIQDIFTKVWVKRSALMGVQSFENYLFTMAKNRLFDLRKQAGHRKQALSAMRNREEKTASVFDEILFKEYTKLALQAFNKLRGRRREIFFLNAHHELTAREIAGRLGLPLTAVKKHLFEAKHFVRNFLMEHGDITSLFICWITFF